jgi:hypothetical protein
MLSILTQILFHNFVGHQLSTHALIRQHILVKFALMLFGIFLVVIIFLLLLIITLILILVMCLSLPHKQQQSDCLLIT